MRTNIKKSYKCNNSWYPVKTTEVFDAYWYFAAERQEIFFQRMLGLEQPWTNDEILSTYKFTNAYRASDRVSQYLIKNVIYSGNYNEEDLLFRILLFKIFNKISTWEILQNKLGEISYKKYSFDTYNQILSETIEKQSIYSAAYIMPSGGNCFGYNKKHQNNLKMLEAIMKPKSVKQILDAKTMQDVFLMLREFPMLGDFLAFQYAIDINYSELTNFSEMSFVVPGPGAYSGIQKCFSDFGGLNEVDLICLVAEKQEEEFAKRGISFKTLGGRKLQLIDCQNLFCEIDKYSRVAYPDIKSKQARTKIKQKYKCNTQPIDFFFPPKWDINFTLNKNNLGDLVYEKQFV